VMSTKFRLLIPLPERYVQRPFTKKKNSSYNISFSKRKQKPKI